MDPLSTLTLWSRDEYVEVLGVFQVRVIPLGAVECHTGVRRVRGGIDFQLRLRQLRLGRSQLQVDKTGGFRRENTRTALASSGFPDLHLCVPEKQATGKTDAARGNATAAQGVAIYRNTP